MKAYESYINKIPRYKTIGGNQLPIDTTTVRNGVQICIQNTTVEEYRIYAKCLEEHGFIQYSGKELPAGTQSVGSNNLYYTYTKEDMHVFFSWNAALHTSRIVLATPKALPDQEKIVFDKQDLCKPCIIQPRLTEGLSYVVQLADTSFIVIDGGLYHDVDLQYLYELLKKMTPEGQKPVISAWMFTHSHDDHIGLATEFIREKAGVVDIKSFAYQFPNCEQMNTRENDREMKQDIEVLERNIAHYYPNALIYTLHTGQTYFFNGLEIEILFTGEDIYPYKAAHYNDTSAALRMIFNNGKTFLVLGDCFNFSCRQLVHTFGDYLKSDILALTHHGLLGGYKELYQQIDPEICFWATQVDRFLGTRKTDKFRYCLGEGGCDYNAWIRDQSIRVRKHYHSSVTTILNMD